MRWRLIVGAALATLGLAQAQTSTVFQDQLTGFTFASYSASYSIDGKAITYRTAVPADVPAGEAYDIVLQVVAPVDVGWAGLAWGGSMTNCPLAVAWQNGQSVTISSRWATGRTLPGMYTDATYEVLKAGTQVNGTHWQFTAKCTGCTQFHSTTLSPTGGHRMAMAYASARPANPASPSSSFPVHTVHNYWTHDFKAGANAGFNDLISKNGGQVSS